MQANKYSFEYNEGIITLTHIHRVSRTNRNSSMQKSLETKIFILKYRSYGNFQSKINFNCQKYTCSGASLIDFLYLYEKSQKSTINKIQVWDMRVIDSLTMAICDRAKKSPPPNFNLSIPIDLSIPNAFFYHIWNSKTNYTWPLIYYPVALRNSQ